MGLEGSIEEFGLADILQLLYFQKKTGLLTVEGRLGRIKIFFYEGDIVDAETKGRLEDKRLGRVLVKKGLLDETRLKEVLEKQKNSREKLGAYLVKNDLVAREAVREVIDNQLTETVVQLFNWKQGSYEFKPQKIALDRELQIKIDTQHLLMEGLRIVDELSVIEGKMNLDTVFRKMEERGLEFTEEEANLLHLIDGESDVSSLIEFTGDDDLKVSKLLLSLIEKGAIEAVEQKTYVVDKSVVKKERSLKLTILSLLAYCMVVLSLFVSLGPVNPGWRETREFKTEEILQRTRMKLEQAKFTAGAYPETLESLFPGIKDAWGRELTYHPDALGYDLRSKGPDGIPGTPDDIF